MPFEEGSVNFLALIVILTNVFAFMLVVFLVIGKSKDNKGNFLLSFLILEYALFVFPEFLYLLGLLISIAYEADFKAKSTFYAVFKKRTGMTANQYRKQFALETAKK